MNLKLRELREARGLKVGQMVKRLDVDDSRYRKWESQTAAIPLKYACTCCDILHCTLDELAGRTVPTLAPDEQTIVDGYRVADTTEKRRMLATAKLELEMAEESALEKKEAI